MRDRKQAHKQTTHSKKEPYCRIETMVLPLVDEHKPKCYYCHQGFENVEQLREHQKDEHVESQEKEMKREPVPGDVTVFQIFFRF